MTYEIAIALPIADRRASNDFFTQVLQLEATGEPGSDGIPEPLQFVLNDKTRVVLVPAVGFGWLIGDHEVPPRGTSECLIRVDRGLEEEVHEVIERARAAGARIVREPERKPWAYEGAFADLDGHVWLVAAD